VSTTVAPDLTFSISAGRSHFLLRRLHSLTGVLFGGYMFVHLVINATLLQGAALYQSQVNKIHDLPFLPAIEWSAIFLPILFHTIYGVWITLSGQWNAPSYSYGRNWLYVLQRITAIILIGFIAFHVLALKYGLLNAISPRLAFDPHHAAQTIIRHMSAGKILVTFVYPVGILAACFHLANGLRAAAVTWGLTISARSQSRWSILCVIIFVVSFAAGMAALFACIRPASHIH
jgi:succinate dehydrogenase / fumarate reductase, cytochrome b subunit